MAGGMEVDSAGGHPALAGAEERYQAFDVGEKAADRWVEGVRQLAVALRAARRLAWV